MNKDVFLNILKYRINRLYKFHDQKDMVDFTQKAPYFGTITLIFEVERRPDNMHYTCQISLL